MRNACCLLALAALLPGGCAARAAPTPPPPPAPDTQAFTLIERGRYLTQVADCAACHTAPGGAPFAGGLPVETPFGEVVSPNITPDLRTGIGLYSNEDFLRVMQHGVARGGQPLYPAMPYPYMTQATAKDDLAIRAYLTTLPAVRHKVVSDQLPFPFSIRASMIAWNALFFSPGRFQPRADKSVAWNRGAYLVNGLAHCGACHTPKTIAGSDAAGEYLQGAKLQGWFAPNITNDMRRGLGRWSSEDIVAYLQTGHNRYAAATGPMAQEVEMSSAHWRDEDLRAVATYLKDQPGQDDTQASLAANDKRMRVGAAIYADECSACHTPKGSGIAGLFPSLGAAPSVQSRNPSSLIRVVLRGAQSAATAGEPTGPAMPAFGWMLSDAQVAAVVSYVRNAWGNAAPAVAPDQVASERASLAARPD